MLHDALRRKAQFRRGPRAGTVEVRMAVMMDRREVLIVDDNAQLRRLLRALLQSDGRFEVVGEAANGREALLLVAELDPELVLLDLSMPDMDGLEVLGRLGEREDPPITVVLSGYTDAALREQVLAAGAMLCLEKGLDFTELTERLATSERRTVRNGTR